MSIRNDYLKYEMNVANSLVSDDTAKMAALPCKGAAVKVVKTILTNCAAVKEFDLKGYKNDILDTPPTFRSIERYLTELLEIRPISLCEKDYGIAPRVITACIKDGKTGKLFYYISSTSCDKTPGETFWESEIAIFSFDLKEVKTETTLPRTSLLPDPNESSRNNPVYLMSSKVAKRDFAGISPEEMKAEAKKIGWADVKKYGEQYLFISDLFNECGE